MENRWIVASWRNLPVAKVDVDFVARGLVCQFGGEDQ